MTFSKPMDMGSSPADLPEPKWGRRNTAGVAIASSLQFQNVVHRYGDRQTLNDISLEVNPGEVMCLLGPSGSGKTTLLKMAAGLIEPEAGQVLIDGQIVSSNGGSVPPEKRGVGLVFQDFALFPHLSILNNVQFGLTALGKRERREHAMRILERVGLSSSAELYPHSLSGGEQQRVALARALAPRPGILLMDEPFSGLDARLRETIRDETLGLLRDTRSTVLIVTHNPEEALNVSDRIALMNDGRIVQVGDAATLYAKPNSLFTARFFSELNVLPGVMGSNGVDGLFRLVNPTNSTKGLSGAVSICVRPTDFQIVEQKSNGKTQTGVKKRPGGNGSNGQVCGHIISRRFLGDCETLNILLEGHEEPIKAHLRVGQISGEARSVLVSVEPGKAMVFAKS